MPLSRTALYCLVIVSLSSCGEDRSSQPFSFRGVTPGMRSSALRAAATVGGIGAMECRPLAVAGVPADLLCYTPDSAASTLNVSAMVNANDSTVPYVVVREGIVAGEDPFGRLESEWGPADTVIGSGRGWFRGQWAASADTAVGILTVWLSDTATTRAVEVAAREELVRAAGLDTMPVVNDDLAIMDSLEADSRDGVRPVPLAELQTRPTVTSCNRVPPPAHLAGRDGAVFLAYIVDTTGRVEPASVRLLHASHGGLVAPAIATLNSCMFSPGRQNGVAVRSVVRQRIAFTPSK